MTDNQANDGSNAGGNTGQIIKQQLNDEYNRSDKLCWFPTFTLKYFCLPFHEPAGGQRRIGPNQRLMRKNDILGSFVMGS
ncbi:MAG: hypothetical protein ACOYOS_24415 [Syntrophales bacterium]